MEQSLQPPAAPPSGLLKHCAWLLCAGELLVCRGRCGDAECKMFSAYIEGVKVAWLGITASHQQPPRPSFSLSPHALPTLFLYCLLRMCFQVSLSFTFFSFFFSFASPPSSETESLTKLDRLVCPLSFLCTSECVLESRVTDDVALR